MIAVAATRNRHKIEEIGAIMGAFGFTLQSQSEAGLEAIDVTEDGDTFEANSLKKAMAIYQACGKTTVADDSGLMVDALDGAPGVYSARFSGEGLRIRAIMKSCCTCWEIFLSKSGAQSLWPSLP